MAGKRALALETYGVCVEVTFDLELSDDIETILPPGWVPCSAEQVAERFAVERLVSGRFRATKDGETIVDTEQMPFALDVLDAQIRAFIALHAPAHVFVHAGAVALHGKAVLLPGRSFSGKTTLVAELVLQGARYLSDEFAVLDADGNVHPYPKPLSIRRAAGGMTDEVPVATLGGDAETRALPVSSIVSATYVPDGVWHPQSLTPGTAALVLLENTVPAQTRPDDSLTAVRSAARGATSFRTERGEAAEAASKIIALLR